MTKRFTKTLTVVFSVVLITVLCISLSGCTKKTAHANAEKAWYNTTKNKSVDTTLAVTATIPLGEPNGKDVPSLVITANGTLNRVYNDNKLSFAKASLTQITLKLNGATIQNLIDLINTVFGSNFTTEMKNLLNDLKSESGVKIGGGIADISLSVDAAGAMKYDYTVYVSKFMSLLGITKAKLSEKNAKFAAALNDANNLIPNKDGSGMQDLDAELYNLGFVTKVMGIFNAGSIRLDRVSVFDLAKAKFKSEKGTVKATVDPYAALAEPLDIVYGLVGELLAEDKTAFVNRINEVVKLTRKVDDPEPDYEKIKNGITKASSKMLKIMSALDPNVTSMKDLVNSMVKFDDAMTLNFTYKNKNLSTMKGKLGGKITITQPQMEALMKEIDTEDRLGKVAMMYPFLFCNTSGDVKYAEISFTANWDNVYYVSK